MLLSDISSTDDGLSSKDGAALGRRRVHPLAPTIESGSDREEDMDDEQVEDNTRNNSPPPFPEIHVNRADTIGSDSSIAGGPPPAISADESDAGDTRPRSGRAFASGALGHRPSQAARSSSAGPHGRPATTPLRSAHRSSRSNPGLRGGHPTSFGGGGDVVPPPLPSMPGSFLPPPLVPSAGATPQPQRPATLHPGPEARETRHVRFEGPHRCMMGTHSTVLLQKRWDVPLNRALEGILTAKQFPQHPST